MYANPYLEISPVELTEEEFLEMVSWFNTGAEPREGMGIESIVFREASSTRVIFTLEYSDETESLTLMIFGERAELQKDHAKVRINDWSARDFVGFRLEPAISGEGTNVTVGIIDSPLSRSYGRVFLRNIILR